MPGAFIRKQAFWLLDRLKGGQIRKNAAKLQAVKTRNCGNPEALKDILEHVIKTVPFYGNIKKAEIESFPVVSKSDYRADFEAFRSKEYRDDEKLHKVYTSGSTGAPFMAYQDAGKIKWHQAGLTTLNEEIGWGLGKKFMFFRVWGNGHNESKLEQIKSNLIPVNVIDFTDDKKEQVLKTILKQKKLKLILGYASALTALCKYIQAKGVTPEQMGIKLIIADSEALSDEDKKLIEQTFGCVVLDRYGNNENGILGITMPNDPRMHINFPEYYVEILKVDSDEPVSPGECGRIVVTDLYNKAFPFIRYDTGDLGIAAEMYQNQCTVLQKLVGRVSSSLRGTKGEMIGETVIQSYFKDLTDLSRFQIVQKDVKKYHILVEGASRNMDAELIERAVKCFGIDADVCVEYVDKIEQGKNGKYQITKYQVKA